MKIKTSTLQKQPASLYILFLTELWERFGFYVVQVLLIFYLTKVNHFSDSLSAAILGAFTAISYITPVVGGFLADRFLGHRHAIIFGGILLSAGYALLATQQDSLFYIALATIAVGTGFFKPNISTFLGNFYSENDSRCEHGYTIFYIGINVGIILSTISAGYILNMFGWRANFMFASIGLLFAIATFVGGLHFLEKKGLLVMLRNKEISPLNLRVTTIIYSSTFLAIYLISHAIADVKLANMAFIIGAVAMLTCLVTLSIRSGGDHTGKMLSCLLLIMLSTLFWALYYQLFFALNLFIDRAIDRSLFGHELPSPVFISLLPVFIMVFGPSIGRLWQTLERKNFNPSAGIKFSLSLFCMAAGLFLLLLGTHFVNSEGLVGKEWVVPAYLLFALGELLISPICIAMVISMVPAAYSGIIMGAYLAGIGFGAKFAGVIAGMADIPQTMQDTHAMVNVYQNAFTIYAEIAFISGMIILAAIPVINWLIRENIGGRKVAISTDNIVLEG